MSIRANFLAIIVAVAAGASPALALQSNFATVVGSSTPLVLPSGDNTLTVSSPADPGAFIVGSTIGLFGFATALGDFASIGGDTLTVGFANPVTVPLTIRFGLEDAFGANGSDTLSVTTNTGVSMTFAAALDLLPLPEPEGTGTIAAPGLTSITLTSANPFAIASITTVPEPSSVALFAAGLIGLGAAFRRRRGVLGARSTPACNEAKA